MGTTVYSYNPITVPAALGAGRLDSIDGPWTNDTISYSYDPLGRILSRSIDGANNSASVIYDNLGRVTSVANLLGTFTNAYIGATGQVDYIDYPNTQRVDFGYYGNLAAAGTGNGDQRLQQIRNLGVGAAGSGAQLSQFDYQYNVTGQITGWTQNYSGAANPQAYTFGYDPADQLASDTLKNTTTNAVIKQEEFAYDRIGNRTLTQTNQAPVQGTSNELNQLASRSGGGQFQVRGSLNEAGSITVEKLTGPGGSVVASQSGAVETGSHAFTARIPVDVGVNTLRLKAKDGTGNLTQKEIQLTVPTATPEAYRYDLNGNLIEYELNGVITRTYEWDSLDRLVKIHDPIADKHTVFTYDGQSRWVKITEATGITQTSEKRFVWEGMSLAEERAADNSVQKRFLGAGEMRVGNVKLFYTRDHLGSIRELTDNTGAVRARYAYTPWGERSKVSGDLDCDFGFTGHYTHATSGLVVAPLRFYNPPVGRWLSRDPIAEEGGLNLYGYVGNDPVNYADPLGNNREVWDGVVKPWIYHKWISVDTWDANGNKTGQVGLHIKKHLYGPTEYSVIPQSETLERIYTAEKQGVIYSTPYEDRALINQWWEWIENGGPDYWPQGTCIGTTNSMKNYRGPVFRHNVDLR